MNRFRWTAGALGELKTMSAAGLSSHVIAAKLGCIEPTVRHQQWRLGLGHARQVKKLWTKADRATVRGLYANMPTAEIARKLGCTLSQVYQCAAKMGLLKSDEYMASPAACRLRRGNNVGAAFRFRKGIVPHNKGLRRPGWGPGRMKETQFKKGSRTGFAAKNWCPIGTIRTDDEGYLRIKVREWESGEGATGFGSTKIWPLLQRHVWEEHRGPIPPGHAVCFKDRDRKNCAIENLELLSRAQLLARNSIYRYPAELVSAIKLLGAVKRKVRESAEKHNDGSAQPSV